MKTYDELIKLLKKDGRFFSEDGEFLRNSAYEAALKMDAKLIKELLKNKTTRELLFVKVDDNYVFDKVQFGWVINNKNFLPDSYTKYKNKIGFANEKQEYLCDSNYIELAFPYKDCVLEGGQTKEEQKRDEIFYNRLLSSDEIDKLLSKKAFCSAYKYSYKNKKEKCESFSKNENLIIKGNNLLSISTLLPLYKEQIKCIYIDVPYNTGNDSFGYNDKFNHSSWLTFMKNRLDIARDLLCKEGTIAISVDNYELAYLMVLLDEIFGKENRKNIITIKRASASGAKVINPGVVNVVEYVVLYSKDTKFWKPNRTFASKGYDDRYNQYIKNPSENFKKWEFETVLDAFAKKSNISKSKLKKFYGDNYEIELENFVIENADRIVRFAALDDRQISTETRTLKNKSKETPNEIVYQHREGYKDYYLLNGNAILFAKDRLIEVDGVKTFSTPLTDIWDDVLPNDLHNEGGVELKKGKKPEKLISRILELCTNEGDIVMDFFAGSGTTGSVALKMNRKFILCEQMDYINDTTCQRLINTIEGEKRGISSAYNWQGGGSFVYCELAKLNQTFVEKIKKAKDSNINDLLEEILKTAYISNKIDPRTIDSSDEEFSKLTLLEKKNILMELLDFNQLYINYCDMDDETMALTKADKNFTKSFYEGTK